MFCLRIYEVCGRPLSLCICSKTKFHASIEPVLFWFPIIFFLAYSGPPVTYTIVTLAICFSCLCQHWIMLISGRKKIKCVAGLNNCFFLVLSSGLICTFVILTQVFFAFTTHLYYSDVAPIFFCACWPVLLWFWLNFCHAYGAFKRLLFRLKYFRAWIRPIHTSGLFLWYIFRLPVSTVFLPIFGYFSAFFVPSSIVCEDS